MYQGIEKRVAMLLVTPLLKLMPLLNQFNLLRRVHYWKSCSSLYSYQKNRESNAP